MIDRLDADEFCLQRRIMAVQIADELELGAAWTDNQHFTCLRQRRCNVGKEIVVFIGLAGSDRTRLMMHLTMVWMRRDVDLFHILGIERKHSGLGVVQPDDSMIVRHGRPRLQRFYRSNHGTAWLGLFDLDQPMGPQAPGLICIKIQHDLS